MSWSPVAAAVAALCALAGPASANTFTVTGPTTASGPDNGLTWEAARPIFDPKGQNQTIANQIVVLPDGTVVDGFTLTWDPSEARLTPTSFDMRTAPFAVGYFVGDYEGLDNDGEAFTLLFVAANDGDTPNPTDVFLSTAG